MTDQSTIASVLAAARVRFISVLVVIALVLGIVTEMLSIASGYYNMNKLAAEAVTANETAKNAERRAKAEADRAKAEYCKAKVEEINNVMGRVVTGGAGTTPFILDLAKECNSYVSPCKDPEEIVIAGVCRKY